MIKGGNFLTMINITSIRTLISRLIIRLNDYYSKIAYYSVLNSMSIAILFNLMLIHILCAEVDTNPTVVLQCQWNSAVIPQWNFAAKSFRMEDGVSIHTSEEASDEASEDEKRRPSHRLSHKPSHRPSHDLDNSHQLEGVIGSSNEQAPDHAFSRTSSEPPDNDDVFPEKGGPAQSDRYNYYQNEGAPAHTDRYYPNEGVPSETSYPNEGVMSETSYPNEGVQSEISYQNEGVPSETSYPNEGVLSEISYQNRGSPHGSD